MALLRTGSIELGEADLDEFMVMCKLSGKSIRAKLATVLMYYMARKRKEYREKLAYTAAKHGLTPEETFKRLLNDEDLGEVVANPEIKFDWASPKEEE